MNNILECGIILGMDTSEFVILPSDVNEESMSGHGTDVRRRETLTGPIAVKTHKTTGEHIDTPDVWKTKIKHARDVADRIRALNNPAYDVPKTHISHGKVYETFAIGTKMRDLSREYIEQNKDWIYPAIAHFMNDMSELAPLARSKNNDVNWVNIKKLNELLQKLGDNLSQDDRDFIQKVHKYLRKLPENELMVFAHNDLHFDNIIIDTENKRVSIIDFEMAGMAPKVSVMYGKNPIGEYVQKYAQNLPRFKNPTFQWDYDPKIAIMYKFFGVLAYQAGRRMDNEPEDAIAIIKKHLQFIKGIDNINTLVTERREQMPQTLVPMSHYQKG